jgi:hypothetical protein
MDYSKQAYVAMKVRAYKPDHCVSLTKYLYVLYAFFDV